MPKLVSGNTSEEILFDLSSRYYDYYGKPMLSPSEYIPTSRSSVTIKGDNGRDIVINEAQQIHLFFYQIVSGSSEGLMDALSLYGKEIADHLIQYCYEVSEPVTSLNSDGSTVISGTISGYTVHSKGLVAVREACRLISEKLKMPIDLNKLGLDEVPLLPQDSAIASDSDKAAADEAATNNDHLLPLETLDSNDLVLVGVAEELPIS